MEPAIVNLINFLVEELRETRKRTLPVSAEFQFQLLLWNSARRSRRLERLAAALRSMDAETNSDQKPE
jgi:hypothetical protein